jgi:enoyl-CoA hydratase/carnithine racemase
MKPETITYTKGDGVATIVFNRPDRLNTLTGAMNREICAAIEDAETDTDIKVLLLTGTGRAFCAGSDLVEWVPRTPETHPMQTMWSMRGLGNVYVRLKRFEKIAIAAINGFAISEGFTIAMLCDIRLASERAKLGEMALKWGTIPDIGSLCILPHFIGLSRAMQYIFSGELIDAEEATRLGIVSEVVAHDELGSRARALAGAIAKGPRMALQLAKGLMYRQLRIDFDSAVQDYITIQQLCESSNDFHEGLHAFLEKRQPSFQGN